jgi:predicted nucleic acid-binding protein
VPSTAYLDSSALVKLVIEESESAALRRWIEQPAFLATCALARTEVVRAVQPAGQAAVDRGRDVLRRLEIVRLDDDLLDAAALIAPPTLRSLDAIHLAAALRLGEDLSAIVTYDNRMAVAAAARGLIVVSPGA